MIVSCPVCRSDVFVSAGYILRHGQRYHGVLEVCSGSGTPYISGCSTCG